MDMWTLQANIFILITVASTARSTSHLATQPVYQKLEHALITDSEVGHLLQDTFFPSQGLPQDLIFISVSVTIDSMLPNAPVNFSYFQKFQWCSSPLLSLISIDQLLILDNVISERIYRITQHHGFLNILLHIDTLPCNTSEDDMLEALMQLLPWVSASDLCSVCVCMASCVRIWHMHGVGKS